MECANCGAPYASYSLKPTWCPTDRVFVCARCLGTARACPACGSRTSNLGTQLLFQGMVFLVLFGILGAVLLPGAVVRSQESALPVTDVSQVAPGSTAKVFGTVSANQSTVILVFTYTDSQGHSLVGRHVEDFWLNDSTGRLLVVMGSNTSSTPTIASGGEPYPDAGNVTGFRYASGDRIAVLGTVRVENSTTELVASAVGPSPAALVRDGLAFDEALFGVPTGGATVAIVVGLAVNRHRLRIHRANLPAWKAKRPRELASAPPGDSVRWADNAYAAVVGKIGWAGNVATGVLAAAWLLVVVSPIPFADPVYTAVAVGAPVGLIFSVVFGGSYTWYRRHAIARLGFSSHGLYIDYRRPPKSARTFVAWSDVRELEAPVPINRRAAKIDTALGAEYLVNLDPDLVRRIRPEFEAARVPFRDRSAPLRPSVASLTGAGAPASVADTAWVPNTLRARWMLRGALFLALEVPALALLVVALPELIFTQALAFALFPAIVGTQLLVMGYRAIREVGVSGAGFSLRERTGERTVLWSDVAEISPGPRGFRYKTFTGFAEGIPLVDGPQVARVVEGLNRARGFDPGTATLPPPPIAAWRPNPIGRKSRNLFLAMTLGPAAASGTGVALALLRPFDPNTIFLIVLPVIVAVFALYPAMWWRASPRRFAVTSEAVYVDRGPRPPPVGALTALPLRSIGSLVGEQAAEGPSALPGMEAYALSVRTRAGVRLGTGLVAPELAQLLVSRLAPDQLTEWKFRPTRAGLARAGPPAP